MCGGPDNVTSTTNTEPPDFLVGPLTTAVNAAQSQFLGGGQPSGGVQPGPGGGPGSGGPASRSGSFDGGRLGGRPGGFPGQQLIPGGTPGGGQNLGQGLIGQAQGLTSQTLGGDFLNPESNPFLQGTFDRAADLTRGRLDTEFAGAGRNLGASFPARSDELQTLASNIFGGNFQAERDRQQNAIVSASDLDPLNRFIDQLGGIIPGAGGTTTSQQPVFKTGLFSDRRLKKNIEQIGEKKGFPWYQFDYIWGEKSEGFMSDELPGEFVSKVGRYDMVDYDAILGG